jgi:nitroimidazol reductase NimA-like FMN-containing flavoprotein (pyridoxamine 5'-phosphate oxidase superfamily)
MRRIEDVLYAALNPVVQGLLRSPFHGAASANLCVLNYRGRHSGRKYTTPLSFVREGSHVRLLSSHNTRWWNNFLGDGAEVEIEIARQTYHGVAKSTVEDSEAFRSGVRAFLTALPRDARVYGIKLDSNRRPRQQDIERAAGHVVLVDIADIQPVR